MRSIIYILGLVSLCGCQDHFIALSTFPDRPSEDKIQSDLTHAREDEVKLQKSNQNALKKSL